MKNKQQVIVIGGGFAGIKFATTLSRDDNFHITVVDRNNYNFFPPLLYQVGTAFLDVASISYPFRKLFRHKKNINFRMGELLEIIPIENRIRLSTGDLQYDYLVLATGTATNYFGLKNIEQHALPMKTINNAVALRNYLLQVAEQASYTTDEKLKKKLSTIVIAGGGPTGVEIAGMLAEMWKRIVQKDYPELKGYLGGDIYLIDGSAALLSTMSRPSQQYAYKALTRLDVKVMLHTRIKDYVNEEVILGEHESIAAKTLIWTAGVTSKIFDGLPEESYGRGNRLLVNAFNLVNNLQNIYAIGDTCLQTTDVKYPDGHPQVAQVAIQQGKNLAKNLIYRTAQKQQKPFTYRDIGSMAIIGANKAVVDLPKPKLHLQGFVAWFIWLFMHLVYLVNFRNRIRTFYNWAAAYLTSDNALRMIISPAGKV